MVLVIKNSSVSGSEGMWKLLYKRYHSPIGSTSVSGGIMFTVNRCSQSLIGYSLREYAHNLVERLIRACFDVSELWRVLYATKPPVLL